jgi:hypothetical protein
MLCASDFIYFHMTTNNHVSVSNTENFIGSKPIFLYSYKKIFWSLFVVMAGLVLARVVDPVTAQQIVGMITWKGI